MFCDLCGQRTSPGVCQHCGQINGVLATPTIPEASSPGSLTPKAGDFQQETQLHLPPPGDQPPIPARSETLRQEHARRLAPRLLTALTMLAVVAASVWLLVQGRADPDLAAPLPRPSASSHSATPSTPDEPASPTTPDTEVTATVPPVEAPPPVVETVTVTAAPATALPSTAASVAAPSSASGPIGHDEAVASVHLYLATAAGNPRAGWDLLTTARQSREDWASYESYWGGLSSARASDVVFDAAKQKVQFTLHTTSASGRQEAATAGWWVARQDGLVRVDVAGGSGGQQVAAEEALEAYRRLGLADLRYDERWVLVLSAKYPGSSDPLQTAANGSNTFYFSDILTFHEDLVQRLYDVNVKMLRTADWGKQGGRDLWFTVADPGGLTSAAEAEAWCAARFPELSGEVLQNQCLPRRMRAPHHS